MAEGLGVGAVGGEEAAEGRPKHSFFVRLEGIRAYHRRSWSTPARLGPTTSTSETPTERQAVADPRFPDPPVLPLRFLQTDPRLFVFSPFAKAQSSALTYVCGSERPLRLRLRWVEDEEEAGREAVVERTSERAPLAYPGLSAQLDKEVLEEGESGELRVAWSGTEAVPHVARPLHLELRFWPADEAERGGERGLRGALEAEVLFRTLPRLTFLPEPGPDHITLYRPRKGSDGFLQHSRIRSAHTQIWVYLSHRGQCFSLQHIGFGGGRSVRLTLGHSLCEEDWERGRTEVLVEWWEAADGEHGLVWPPGAARGLQNVLTRFEAAVRREAERPVQSLRLPVLLSRELALRFGDPGPVALHPHTASRLTLENLSQVEVHWLAVAEASVAVEPDEGQLAGEAEERLSLSLVRLGHGLGRAVTELRVYFALGERPDSLLFNDDPDRVAHIRIFLHHP